MGRNKPGMFDDVRKWRRYCANTALDTQVFTHGSSDLRILARSVLDSVRQPALQVQRLGVMLLKVNNGAGGKPRDVQ